VETGEGGVTDGFCEYPKKAVFTIFFYRNGLFIYTGIAVIIGLKHRRG